MKYETTYKKGLKLIKFKKGDLIYISKIIRGFQIIFKCKFIEIKKGIVYAMPIDCEPEWYKAKLRFVIEIKARKNKCFVWGNERNFGWEHCIWFNSKGELK